jgi:hypothetical protein
MCTHRPRHPEPHLSRHSPSSPFLISSRRDMPLWIARMRLSTTLPGLCWHSMHKSGRSWRNDTKGMTLCVPHTPLQRPTIKSLTDASAQPKGRPYLLLSASEEANLIRIFEERSSQSPLTVPEAIILRKLKLQRVSNMSRFELESVCYSKIFFQHSRAHNLPRPLLRPKDPAAPLTALPPAPRTPERDPEVLRALYDIMSTPYQSSFLSRLNGIVLRRSPVVATDWDARAPWMDLMEDIRAHYTLKLYARLVFVSQKY